MKRPARGTLRKEVGFVTKNSHPAARREVRLRVFVSVPRAVHGTEMA